MLETEQVECDHQDQVEGQYATSDKEPDPRAGLFVIAACRALVYPSPKAIRFER